MAETPEEQREKGPARIVHSERTRPLTSGWGSKNEGVPEGRSYPPLAGDETTRRGSTRQQIDDWHVE